jgi:F-type H+-transporting ATPase subunit alpha
MLELDHGVVGLALNLEEDNVGAVLFGDWEQDLRGRHRQAHRRASLEVPVGEALLGRVVDPLGNPLDGKGPIDTTETRPLEFKAPGVVQRQPVTEPMQTGIKAIDAMIPIGRGQRELIIGDRQTGKTAIAIDTIINQHDRRVCIYVAIGQKASTVAAGRRDAARGTARWSTRSSSPRRSEAAPIKFMAPFAGCAMGEYFLYKGEHALSSTTTSPSRPTPTARCRCCCAARRAARPTRATSSTCTRGCSSARQAERRLGGGSLTALPIIETQAGDVSAYIPTNVISITDGQIFLESDLFYSGVRPAINVGISVSRVGSATRRRRR